MVDLDQHQPAIAAGSAEAFGSWVAGAERVIRESLRAFAASVDTEAVLQEALLRIWQVAPRFAPDGRPNGLLRLAIRTARNLAVSEVRRLRTRPVEADDMESVLALHAGPVRVPAADPRLRETIAACRDKLPEKPAQALSARLSTGGCEPDETLAEQLQMKLNTFLQNVTRARKMLAECLRACGVDLDMELS